MDVELVLNLLDALIIIGVAIPTLYMASKVKHSQLRILTLLLGGFLLVHGLYHATAALGTMQGLSSFGVASDLFVEPLGWLLFLGFAVYFTRKSG